MPSVLRYYRLDECWPASGEPYDWERCRRCDGSGKVAEPQIGFGRCPACDGHGSLKAAVLASKRMEVHAPHSSTIHPARCEDCGHPMSEGAWENRSTLGGPGAEEDLALFMRADRPRDGAFTRFGIHYSPCDEGCRHGLIQGRDLIDIDHGGEASWRQVDIRTLDRPCMLEPQYLAVLCLRCWAAR